MVRAMSTFTAARPRTALATRWQWGRMTELAVGDLYAVMAARQEVFAVEQGCAFLDADGLDANAFHLLGWDPRSVHPVLACYLRLVDPGQKFAEPSLGRVLRGPRVSAAGDPHRRAAAPRSVLRLPRISNGQRPVSGRRHPARRDAACGGRRNGGCAMMNIFGHVRGQCPPRA